MHVVEAQRLRESAELLSMSERRARDATIAPTSQPPSLTGWATRGAAAVRRSALRRASVQRGMRGAATVSLRVKASL